MTTNTPMQVAIMEPQFPMVAVQIFDTPAPGSGGGGSDAPATTNLLEGDGLGGFSDSGIPAINLKNLIVLLSVNSFNGSTAPGIATVPVGELAIPTLAILYSGEIAVLEVGQADVLDPGQAQPVDYNLTSNNKHWRQVK